MPLPTFQQSPSPKIPFAAHILFYVYELLFPNREFKNFSFGKYFALRTSAIKEFGLFKILHPCFANNEVLNWVIL
ncbi:Cell wall integrity and stress response component 1 [Gossypium arboreum]|uniref:Cell wall integrity and stress response component 1 n=1 Tax=Gossypium arboreum TaxID=29729 RepID=A0A0B0N357_GOSAR|nr:Cell wall integrity and stress response component 1 [Gossypium arboreum]